MTTKNDLSKRRESISNALDSLALPGEITLSEFDRNTLTEVLCQLLDGGDVLRYLGIKPKRGRPALDDDIKLQIAVHYWVLRDREPKQKDEVARRIVAEIWGCTPEGAYKAAARYKSKAKMYASLSTRQNQIDKADYFAAIHRGTKPESSASNSIEAIYLEEKKIKEQLKDVIRKHRA